MARPLVQIEPPGRGARLRVETPSPRVVRRRAIALTILVVGLYVAARFLG